MALARLPSYLACSVAANEKTHLPFLREADVSNPHAHRGPVREAGRRQDKVEGPGALVAGQPAPPRQPPGSCPPISCHPAEDSPGVSEAARFSGEARKMD